MRETILMKKNSGFTLMEVMVTVGIIAIMSAIAIPNVISYLPKHRLNGGARDVYSAMQYARLRAVKEKTPVSINFNPGANSFRVFIDDVTTNGVFEAGETELKTGNMPVDVNMISAAFSMNGPWPGNATGFDGRGLPLQSVIGSVQLQSTSQNLMFKEIRLRISGSVVIRTSTDGGSTWN